MKKKQKKYTYYLDEDEHSHVILWLNSQKNIAAATRTALEFYVEHQTKTRGDNSAGQVIDKQVVAEAIESALARPDYLGMIRKIVEAAVHDVLSSVQLKTLPAEMNDDDGISFIDEIGDNFIIE